MRVVIEFDIRADIIECPEIIVPDLITYQDKFFEWLYNKNNDHDYWEYENGKKSCLCYRADALIEWLNTFVLDEEKAYMIKSGADTWDTSLPKLFF